MNFAGALGFTIASVKAARPGRREGLERSMALLFEYAEGPVGLLSYSWDVATLLGGVRVSRIYGREGSLVFESNGLFVATSGRKWRIRLPGLGDIYKPAACAAQAFDLVEVGRPQDRRFFEDHVLVPLEGG